MTTCTGEVSGRDATDARYQIPSNEEGCTTASNKRMSVDKETDDVQRRITLSIARARRIIYFLVRLQYFAAHEVMDICLVCRAWRDVVDTLWNGRKTAIFTSLRCLEHHIPRRSERPERISLVLTRCQSRYPHMRCINDLSVATVDQLARFHTEIHVDTITRLGNKIERSMVALHKMSTMQPGSNGCTEMHTKQRYYAQFEYIDIDADTIMMRHTLVASQTAAGAVCHAIDYVMQQKAANAFCVVRPPGHHAEPQRAMGFCFFNNVGVGAFHALDRYGCKRVCIIDFDVHHGNGTQKRVEQEERIMYISLHQAPLFPGTGFAHECGKYNNIVNVPLPKRTTSKRYRRAFLEKVVPRVHAFAPELILISAGFDAHALDPLAEIQLQSHDYYWLTAQITALAWQHCHGRVVSVLEGGYHPRALAESAGQHLQALVHGSISIHCDWSTL